MNIYWVSDRLLKIPTSLLFILVHTHTESARILQVLTDYVKLTTLTVAFIIFL